MQNQAETNSRFVEFDLDVNSWAKRRPDVAAGRPSRCPRCGAPGQSGDGRVILHGHGRRSRTVLGPPDADGQPRETALELRRYACQSCDAVITVGPRGLLAWRRYTAMAIGLALWRWAVLLVTDPRVRLAISPVPDQGASRPERWTTLRRWARAASGGQLWPNSPVASEATLRGGAARLARWLRGFGDPLDSDEAAVFLGSAHAR